MDFDFGWRFNWQDTTDDKKMIDASALDYYQDSGADWSVVNLPHDWSAEKGFNTATSGGKNVVAVRVVNKTPNSRWYSGVGITRNVWLNITNDVHVAQNGTFVTTPTVLKDNAKVNKIVYTHSVT